MNENESNTPQRNENESTTPKRKRTPFENREKEILCQIVKETDGGRIWKLIKEGTGTNQAKYVAWEKVTKLFNAATGKNCDRKQMRDLFDRIKGKQKQSHDRDSQQRGERNFNRACGLTGGGPSPLVPPEPDGDKDLDFGDLDPTSTQFNTFTPANDVENMAPSTPRTPFRPPSTGPRFRFPAPSPFRHGTPPPGLRTCSPTLPSQVSPQEDPTPDSEELPNLRHVSVLRDSRDPSTSPSPSRQRAQQSAGEAVVTTGTAAAESSGTSSAASSSQTLQTESSRIDLITAGDRITIEAVGEVPPKKSKKGTKKNMNETASDYYSEMLKIQENLSKLKEKVLKRRERVEILKERILMRQLEKEGGTVPEWMEDDDDDEDSSSSEYEV